MPPRPKTFTANRPFAVGATRFAEGDPVDGAALAYVLRVRPDLLDSTKPPPPDDTTTESEG